MTPAGPLDVVDRFDGATAWATLPDAMKTAIGAAILERDAADSLIEVGEDAGDERMIRVGLAAYTQAEIALDRALSDLPGDGLGPTSGQPRIPAMLGMVCEVCGCSETSACPQGCGWARDNLCTACTRPATAAE